jgi:uncharacterized protein (DUF362 family)
VKKGIDIVRFTLHSPKDWYGDKFNFSPELHFERYTLLPDGAATHLGLDDEPQKVYFCNIGDVPRENIATQNYSTSYYITQRLLAQVPKAIGGKVLVKPNNTGFMGLFYNNPQLREILLNKKGMKVDADHQSIATQPAIVAGIVDALLKAGVQEVHVGENMLWDGGTPRAFWETGYTQYFAHERYAGKVSFVDFYETDDIEVTKLPIAHGDYDLGGFEFCYPPKALFDEHYALILSAAIAKIHNCSYYTLAAKNFSVTWNPPRPRKDIHPRWHIHGLPLHAFDLDYLKHVLGNEFHPQYDYRFKDLKDADKISLIKSPKYVAMCADDEESAPIKTYMSCGQRVLQIDPHHHAGSNLITLNLGMLYLVARFTGIFATMLKELNAQGTKVATICSGIVGQEGEGPLVYGSLRYGGFNLASFNHAGIESLALNFMMGKDRRGFAGYVEDSNNTLQKEYQFRSEGFLDDARKMWSLALLSKLTREEIDQTKIPLEYMDFTQKSPLKSAQDIFKLRKGPPFTFTDAFYCSPKTWLRLIHTEKGIYKHATKFFQKGVEIPLIPGVVN